MPLVRALFTRALFCCGCLLHPVAPGTSYAQTQFPSLTIPSYESAPAHSAPMGTPSIESPAPARSYSPPLAGDFSITVRTDLLTAFVNRETVKSGNVSMRVMEADVRGVQTTTTSVRLQSSANSSKARLNIQTSGNVSSNTIGYTPQAQVATLGSHTFNVTKPVFFDGNRFLTKKAFGAVQARQFPQGVNTVASGMPLVGRIGEQIAWNEVQRRMPVSNSIVVRQVADDVLPQVNTAVDGQLAELNRKWRKLRHDIDRILGHNNLKWSASSTPQSFSTTALNNSIEPRLADPKRQLLSDLAKREVVAVVFSEDGINHLLARQPLGDLTISDASLQQLALAVQGMDSTDQSVLEPFKKVFGQPAEPLLFSVKLATHRPIQIGLENGLFILQLKFQVLPKVGEPGQMNLMKVRLGGQSGTDGVWAVTLKDVTVEPASRNEQPDSWSKIMSTQAPQLVKNVPPTELSRQIDLERFHEKLPALRLHRIQTENAQLRVSFRLDDSLGQITTGRPRTFGPSQ